MTADQVLDPELLRDPEVHAVTKQQARAREGGEDGGEQALGLHERLLVEDYVVEVARAQLGLGQAEVDGLARERGVVLLSREALFLGGGDELAVDEQRGGGVVVVAADAEDVHWR